MSKVEQFIAAAMRYKGDKYSQPRRMEKGYSDCSSLIQKAGADIGLWHREKDWVTTYKMGVEGDSRFRQIPMGQLQRGDILWGGSMKAGKWSGHVAMYLGNGKTLEARVTPGVDYSTNRAYFTRAYRIVALEEKSKNDVIENVPIVVNGIQLKTKGYIDKGVTYVDIDKVAYPVRRFFEGLGCEVKWINEKVQVKL